MKVFKNLLRFLAFISLVASVANGSVKFASAAAILAAVCVGIHIGEWGIQDEE